MKNKTKTEINPETAREREEKRKTEMLYSGEINRRLILCAILANSVYTTGTFGYNYFIPPVFLTKIFD